MHLYKSGSQMEAHKYRPVSFLSILAKHLGTFVHDHFNEFLDQHHLSVKLLENYIQQSPDYLMSQTDGSNIK